MSEVQNGCTNETTVGFFSVYISTLQGVQKRKGYLSNIFGGRSSRIEDKRDDQLPKRKKFMNSLMDNARQAAAKEVMHVAEEETAKQVEAALDNNEPQPTDATDNAAPDTTTPGDVLAAPVNWAKRMVAGAQQKVQGLQNFAS